jgi:hypothetical protein
VNGLHEGLLNAISPRRLEKSIAQDWRGETVPKFGRFGSRILCEIQA